MIRRLVRLLIVLTALATVPLWVQCCSSTTSSPAAAPAPPIEVPAPAVLKFVDADQMKVDLSAITTTASPLASTASLSAEPAVSKATTLPAPAIGDQILDSITTAPDIFDVMLTRIFRPALAGIGEMEIPSSTQTTRYEADIQFSATDGILTGLHHVKLNFAPFDYDGDGTAEACSGNTGSLPICARFCLDEGPFIAGVFEEWPSLGVTGVTDTIGKGKFKLFVQDHKGYQSKFEYHYDQNLTQQFKTVTYSGRTTILPDSANFDPATAVIDNQTFTKADQHGTTSQGLSVEGDAIPAIKNVNLNMQFESELNTEGIKAFFVPICLATHCGDPDSPGYAACSAVWSVTCVCGTPASNPANHAACVSDPSQTETNDPSAPWMTDPSAAPEKGDHEYVGQYVDGGGYWSGSFTYYMWAPRLFTSLFGTPDVIWSSTDLCATLPPAGILVDGSLCADVGPDAIDIRVGQTPYIAPLTPTDVELPSFNCDDPTF